MPARIFRIETAAVLFLIFLFAAAAFPQQLTPAGSGFIAVGGNATLQVTALRDDVLRVRMWQGGTPPEDASWAVLPQARTSTVAVTAEAHGFATRALRVSVDEHLLLTVADLQGNILQRDAAPAIWEGTRFTVSKQRNFRRSFLRPGRQARTARPSAARLHHVEHGRLRLAGVDRPHLQDASRSFWT